MEIFIRICTGFNPVRLVILFATASGINDYILQRLHIHNEISHKNNRNRFTVIKKTLLLCYETNNNIAGSNFGVYVVICANIQT
jgi:hypothetical protein